MTVKTPDGITRYTLHETTEEDDDRTRIYHGTETDGAIQCGSPGKRPPLWLQGIIKKEMNFFNDVLHGVKPDTEYEPLLNGKAARSAIATADAATRSLKENRKASLSEITENP